MGEQAPLFPNTETLSKKLDHARISSLLDDVRMVLLQPSWKRQRWFTLAELVRIIGRGSEASVSARLRDLRKAKFGGFTVERRRRGDPKRGLWEYRIP